jgi:hypothetical protein
MSILLPVLFANAALAAPEALAGAPQLPPRPEAPPAKTAAALPVGKWTVEYANGVTEVCKVAKDGTATVVEPVRIPGKAVLNGGAVVMVFENGRVQRWTRVGRRLVVEHWFPESPFPSTMPGVVGIAEPIQ